MLCMEHGDQRNDARPLRTGPARLERASARTRKEMGVRMALKPSALMRYMTVRKSSTTALGPYKPWTMLVLVSNPYLRMQHW